MKREAVVSFVLVMLFLVSMFPMNDFFGVANSHGSSGVSESQSTVAQGGNANGLVPVSTNRARFRAAPCNSLPRTSDAAASPSFCEMLGLTFTQNFGSMSYNVTAVAQDYPDAYGTSSVTGPAYLLCGLSNTWFMYEVGLSWDWLGTNAFSSSWILPSGTYTPGFNANFWVFNPAGNQVYPSGSNVLLESLAVNQGDIVQLTLVFSGPPNNNVVMSVYDWNTTATSSQVYSDPGATTFLGLPTSWATPVNTFTGLMTEQWHTNPYYSDMQQVVYSDMASAKSSAWMWMQQISSTGTFLFSVSTPNPVSFVSPRLSSNYSLPTEQLNTATPINS